MVHCEGDGSRYHQNFWGTRALTGRIDLSEPDRLFDADGTRPCVRGLDPADLATCRHDDIAGFFELHIEQGWILEAADDKIGVVERITRVGRVPVTVEGQGDHAGSTPLDLRRDAAHAAAEVKVAISNAADALGWPAVTTICQIEDAQFSRACQRQISSRVRRTAAASDGSGRT